MDCHTAERLLPNYLDDELTEELQGEVQAHLLGCRNCAWQVESIRATVNALAAGGGAEAPEREFRESLLARLLQDHRQAQGSRPYQPGARRQRPPFLLDLPRKEAGHGR